MEVGERRGSVTSLLRKCVATYTQASPLQHPPPEPDCWDEARRPPRQARFAANNRLQRKTERTSVTAEVAPGKKDVKQTESNQMKSGNIFHKSDENKTVTKDTTKLSSSSVVAQKKSPNETIGVKAIEATAAIQQTGNPDIQPQVKRRPRVMGGCSGAYQRAVRKVRGEAPVDSVVLLGLPGEDQVTLHHAEPSQHSFCTSSFTVAIAATKMKALGLRKGTVNRKVVSSGGRDDDSEHTSPLLGGRRPERPRIGKKMFEDAYVATWSQPILPADDKDFNITFEKPKKVRVVRVGKLRRKSLGSEVPLPPEGEEPAKEESEWLEWRRTHDRVQQWLKDNTLIEADESHVVAMLLEPDAKKGALYRS
ncbi:uncharacterized protein [Panulirus ornatus]|uniref:uncharacterized protein isoform X2 n=1 Tax=Panulirus ornatus TaxID=150431 RepID=UPI003A882B07